MQRLQEDLGREREEFTADKQALLTQLVMQGRAIEYSIFKQFSCYVHVRP